MRGQAGMDFMMSVVAVLAFVLVFYVTVFGQLNRVPDRLEIEQLCDDMAVRIGAAYRFGDGFSQNISTPLTMEQGVSFNITIYTNSLVCRSTQDVIKPHTAVIIRNASNSQPPFQVRKGVTVIINNTQGTVFIT